MPKTDIPMMVYPHKSYDISLRWHYPNQVTGLGIHPTLSLLDTQAPLFFFSILRFQKISSFFYFTAHHISCIVYILILDFPNFLLQTMQHLHSPYFPFHRKKRTFPSYIQQNHQHILCCKVLNQCFLQPLGPLHFVQ